VSSAGVYGDGDGPAPHDETAPCRPTNEYEHSKLEAEKALAAELHGSSVVWTVLRPGGLYGPGRASTVEFYEQVARRRIWLHGLTRVIVHPTHVGDLIQAILLVVGAPDLEGETINVAGDRPIVFKELVGMVAERLGARLTQIALPFSPRLVNRAVQTSKARRKLGFAPMPLERGLDDTIAWARHEGLLAVRPS
jgi:nucleoside-diphosphate-sugar epimerase